MLIAVDVLVWFLLFKYISFLFFSFNIYFYKPIILKRSIVSRIVDIRDMYRYASHHTKFELMLTRRAKAYSSYWPTTVK